MTIEVNTGLKILAIVITLSIALITYAAYFATTIQKMKNDIERLAKDNEHLKQENRRSNEQIALLHEHVRDHVKTFEKVNRRIEFIQAEVNNLQAENNIAEYCKDQIEYRILESKVELIQIVIDSRDKYNE